jgi:hypothetical protein
MKKVTPIPLNKIGFRFKERKPRVVLQQPTDKLLDINGAIPKPRHKEI